MRWGENDHGPGDAGPDGGGLRGTQRPEWIHHSDQGSQYCAHNDQARLKQFGFWTSMSR